MQINAPIPTQVVSPKPVLSPAVQAAVVAAGAQQQPGVATARTQTVQAPQANGRADASRQAQDGTKSGQAIDTIANAVRARTNADGYGRERRGSLLDVSV